MISTKRHSQTSTVNGAIKIDAVSGDRIYRCNACTSCGSCATARFYEPIPLGCPLPSVKEDQRYRRKQDGNFIVTACIRCEHLFIGIITDRDDQRYVCIDCGQTGELITHPMSGPVGDRCPLPDAPEQSECAPTTCDQQLSERCGAGAQLS